MPEHLPQGAGSVLAFCKAIVEATAPYALAYKVNFAFFEALGTAGWDTLYRVRELLPADALLIADAKRGDIGTSSERYARAIFEALAFDAVTLSPYMGHDSVAPFLGYPERWVFLLGLTSNPGAADFQQLPLASGGTLAQAVLQTAQSWPRAAELGFVVGATRPDALLALRQQSPEPWFLVPGVGAQGGESLPVLSAAATPQGGVLLTVSRGILYASTGPDFAAAAAAAARAYAETTQAFVPAGAPIT